MFCFYCFSLFFLQIAYRSLARAHAGRWPSIGKTAAARLWACKSKSRITQNASISDVNLFTDWNRNDNLSCRKTRLRVPNISDSQSLVARSMLLRSHFHLTSVERWYSVNVDASCVFILTLLTPSQISSVFRRTWPESSVSLFGALLRCWDMSLRQRQKPEIEAEAGDRSLSDAKFAIER